MNKLKEKLTKKIRGSDLFIILGTRNYMRSLKENDESIAIQIDTARKFKKPFFIIIDRNLPKEDRQYLEEYFSNRASTIYIAKQIKTLVKELRTTGDYTGVNIATPYDDEDESYNDN
mgnify:CR=1 FL=1